MEVDYKTCNQYTFHNMKIFSLNIAITIYLPLYADQNIDNKITEAIIYLYMYMYIC